MKVQCAQAISQDRTYAFGVFGSAFAPKRGKINYPTRHIIITPLVGSLEIAILALRDFISLVRDLFP
jgi:hypothetical protein